MSHHLDSVTAQADGRLNLLDLYAYDRPDHDTSVQISPGRPARFDIAGGNGRTVHDDALDITLSAFLGVPVDDGVVPAPVLPDFLYVNPPESNDLPAFIPR